MANHSNLGSLFSDIASAIRSKTGSSAEIVADNFPSEIASIPTGGGTTINPTVANEGYLSNSGASTSTTVTLSNDHYYLIVATAKGATASRTSSWKVMQGQLTQLQNNTASFTVTKSGTTYTLRVTGGSYGHDYNVYQLD